MDLDHNITTSRDTAQLALLCALALTLLLAAPAWAGKIRVETNGVDTDTCGTKTAPCRTITRALAHAPEGGTIVVGPGRYGDLDGDGTLGEAEEENPEDCGFCVLEVTKRVTIVSRAGAGATIITGGNEISIGVRISADRVVFGRKKRGFTLVGSDLIAVSVFGDHVRVAGNFATAGNTSYEAKGAHAVFGANSSIGNSNNGFILRSESRPTLVGNRAIGNGHGSSINARGISTVGAGATIVGNVASANESLGIGSIRGGDAIVKNVIVGNRVDPGNSGTGILVGVETPIHPTEPTLIKQNLILGNSGPGVFAYTDAATTIEKNVIYGNDWADNCGALNQSGVEMRTTKNFWGLPIGPGIDPADELCATIGIVVAGQPATRQARIRVRAAR